MSVHISFEKPMYGLFLGDLEQQDLYFGWCKKKSSVDFTALFRSLLLPLLSSASSASFMWMDGSWGRKCGLLLDTQKYNRSKKHTSTFIASSISMFLSVSVSTLSSILLHFSLWFSPSSERDTSQSAVHSSFGKISQPLPDQPRQPQPTPGKTRIHKQTHTQTQIHNQPQHLATLNL